MPNLALIPDAIWWLIAGAALLTLEVVLPGVFLLWLGLAALIIGGLLFAMPLALAQQFIAFAALAVVLVLFARMFLRYGVSVSDRSSLNARGHRYVGQTVVVAETIAQGRGKVRVGDTLWNAAGPDAQAGSSVRVTAVDGTLLKVEPAS